MKNSTLWTVVFILAISIGLISAHCNSDGILIVPGWAHGVVVCGEVITINPGHHRDPEMQELLALADTCPQ